LDQSRDLVDQVPNSTERLNSTTAASRMYYHRNTTSTIGPLHAAEQLFRTRDHSRPQDRILSSNIGETARMLAHI
jgi:hypothetical protein